MNWIFTFLLSSVFLITGYAQNSFEGIITYTIEYQNIPDSYNGQEHLLPTQLKLYCKDGLYRLEHIGVNQARIQLVDYELAESIVLLNLLGEHIALRKPSEEVQTERALQSTYQIKRIPGKIDVAGYTCHQANVYDASGQLCASDVAYTSSLKGVFPELPEFKGLPLKFSTSHEGMSMTYTASSVEQISLDRALFRVPEGYALVNSSEMSTIFNNLLPEATESDSK